METQINSEDAGLRLDQFAARQLPMLSRAYVQKLCDEELILINGHPGKPGYKLREGDNVTITYDVSSAGKVDDIDLPILYQDDDVIVINKPAGVLTHALGKHGSEASVASFLRGKVSGLTGDRAGIVHRLDRATSGVIVGAKSQAALSWLQKQFAQRKVKKTYVAIVKGHLKQPEAIIDMPIERNPKAPAMFRVGSNGKSATTHYKVLEANEHYSLVELRPTTGRTHQLRVHLAHIGHPIVGDPLYGGGKYGDRLYLHALSLEITLPNRKRQVFVAPLPDEFKTQMG